MKHRSFALIFSVILVAFLASAISCKSDKSLKHCTFDAIPENSDFIIKTSDIDSVTSIIGKGNPLFDIIYLPKTGQKDMICNIADSIKSAGILANHLHDEAIIALRKDGNCGIAQLYVRATNICDKSDITSIIDSLKQDSKLKTKTFEETEIFEFGDNLFMGIASGIAVFSTSSKYLEDALQCYNGKSPRLSENEKFNKAFSTVGKNELANILVNTKKFSSIFTSELFSDNVVVQTISNFDCWAGFDLVRNSPLVFNGFEFPQKDTAYFSDFVKTQPSIEFNSLAMIPEKASSYILMSFADSKKYDESLDQYLQSVDKKRQRDKLQSDMNKAFGFDAKSKFYSIIKREFAFVMTENSDEAERGAYIICGLQSQTAAEMELQSMISEDKYISLDDYPTMKIFEMPFDDIPAALFGDFFANCRGNYVCCHNNFLIFANSLNDIRALIREVVLNNTMKHSIEHSEFLENFSTASSIFVYYSFGRGTEILKRALARQYGKDIDEKRGSFAELGIAGMQLKKLEDMVYCNIAFAKSSEKSDSDYEKIWETNIGNSIATKPFVVTNHDSGEKEVIVQDNNNTLYLLNSSGREIWHIEIDGRITSQIVQVDAFNNGKLQYLFSTNNKIYLIDRLGNSVNKFPISLRTKASAPISVFDYDNNKNYRIFAACEDKNVYVYDINGDLLKGWEFGGTENYVNSEINHYVIETEDFIVFHDAYTPYFIARNGSSKMRFSTNFEFSGNNIYCDQTSSAKFVTTDKNGVVRRFFKSEIQDSIVFEKFSPNHKFAMKDIDFDGRPDYIFTDSSRICVYGNDKHLIFDYKFDAQVSAPLFFSFGNQVKIGVGTSDNKIYLFNPNGTIHEGFPIDGKSPFSIYGIEGLNGVYGLLTETKGVSLCNYKVEK